VKRILSFAAMVLALPCLADEPPMILLPRDPTPVIRLAAKEIRRYVYLRTGVFCDISSTDGVPPGRSDVIALAPAGAKILDKIPLTPSFRDSLGAMRKDGFVLRTIDTGTGRLLLIGGHDDVSTLYGAYAFAESQGIRFYAHGDVIPDGTIPFQIPRLDRWHAPLFVVRGLQPFHDFPEGPDWWDVDDYKALFSQMAKLRMNFFGLHTYPEGGAGPEPTVWIGLKEDIRPDGEVATGYPSRYFTTTGDRCWGYDPRRCGDYLYGLGELFDSDSYGSEVMRGFSPHVRIGSGEPIPPDIMTKVEPLPISPAQWNDLFARTARFYAEAFTYGRNLGVKMCAGTETPLTIPARVQGRIRELGKDTTEARLRQELYAGMFERITQTIPLDYYWFWTPESWTWSGNNRQQVEQTRLDLEAAQRAAAQVRAPFSLATCGWVLGPKDDRSMFDTFLPKSWAISCISRDLGYEPVDPGFARISGREKWAIPWLEDDPALTLPQFWVGRMRRDAADALAYGCTGLIGIHWRTRVLSANISSLARAGWEQAPWNPRVGERLTPAQALARSTQTGRDLSPDDYYLDWAENHFGRNVASRAAALFSRLDGMEKYDRGRASLMNMPVPADWVSGPGGVKPDSLTWDERKKDYVFVEEFESIRREVTGAGNVERCDYWLNTFRYLRSCGKFACSAGEINRLIAGVKRDSLGDARGYRGRIIEVRTRQMQELEEVFRWLLGTVRTKGELGTIANWQQHIVVFSVTIPGREIEKLLGEKLPECCWPSGNVLPREGIIIPTVRTAQRVGEDLRIRAILPSAVMGPAHIRWRRMSGGEFATRPLAHRGGAVWEVTIRGDEITDDLEYFIDVRTPQGIAHFPAGAPGRNQSVVIY
jgi:hypothetical protein